MTTKYSRFAPGKYCLFIDWETSGVTPNNFLKSVEDYQGISFGAVVARTDDFEEVDSIYRELHLDDKYGWQDEAENIHGLSREHLKANGVSREEALTDLLELIIKYWGPLSPELYIQIGGHNTGFDIRFTDQLTNDFGFQLNWHHVVLETSSLGFVAIGEYKSDKVFSFFGGEKRGKHNALEDARQSLAVARGVRQLCNAALETV